MAESRLTATKVHGWALGAAFWGLVIAASLAEMFKPLIPLCLVLFVCLLPTILVVYAILSRSQRHISDAMMRAAIAVERAFDVIPHNPFAINLPALIAQRATWMLADGQYSEALATARVAYKIWDDRAMTDPQITATVVGTLAQAMMVNGNAGDALDLCRQAIDIHRPALAKKPEEAAGALIGLSLCFRHTEQFEAAEKLLQEAIAAIENSPVGSAPESKFELLFGALNNLGVIYLAMERLEEAAAIFARCLSLKQSTTTEHSELLWAHSNYAVALLEMSQCEQAEKHLQVAEHIVKTTKKPLDPSLLMSMEQNVGQLRLKQGRFEEGLVIAMDVQKKLDGMRNAHFNTVIDNLLLLAQLFDACGKFEDSEEWFQRCLTKIQACKPVNQRMMDKAERGRRDMQARRSAQLLEAAS